MIQHLLENAQHVEELASVCDRFSLAPLFAQVVKVIVEGLVSLDEERGWLTFSRVISNFVTNSFKMISRRARIKSALPRL